MARSPAPIARAGRRSIPATIGDVRSSRSDMAGASGTLCYPPLHSSIPGGRSRLTGPAVGEPDQHRAAPSRTGSGDAAAGVPLLLALGLAFRFIIAYVLLPKSGFGVDIGALQFWAENLAHEGLRGFYQRDFFHDYTPGYLYVLWALGL